jgi:NAD(P)-dependent dehydrogenase (short-subunit alcohol dehydrogenase family)
MRHRHRHEPGARAMTAGRVALVTGASSGIGRASAIALADAGYRTFAGVRCLTALSELEGLVESVELDVTDPAGVQRAVAHVVAAGGGLNLLVNNAGYSHPGPLELLEDIELARQFDVNALGLMRVTRAALPALRRQRGRIINIGSPMGRSAVPLHGAYTASKAAAAALSDALRIELAPLGVDVVLIEPGVIRTRFADVAMSHPSVGEAAAGSPYESAVAGLPALYERMYRKAPEADTVAAIVLDAAQARRPRARYIGARQRARSVLLNALPPQLGDRLKRRVLGYRIA